MIAAMTRLMLALAALVALGAGAWWLSSDPAADSAPAARPQGAAQREPTSQAPTTAPVESPSASAERAGERSAAELSPPPPEPQGIEDGQPAAQVGRDFSWKYKELDQAELLQRLDALEAQVQQTLDGEMLPRFADGRFVEHRIERGESRTLAKVLSDFGSDDPWCRVWPVFDPAGASSPTAQQQLIAVRVVCLTPSEHPGLADLMDERAWLRGQRTSSGR